MKYEFRAPTLEGAVQKAIAYKDGRVENDNQVKTCKYISQQIIQVGRDAARCG